MSVQVMQAFDQHIALAERCKSELLERVFAVSEILCNVVLREGEIFFCGNGGSAADAQHLAAELIGRFKRERRSVVAIALTTDTSILTALGNNYSFDEIFSRQVAGLASPGDIVVAISTSGRSRNVLRAVEEAKTRKCITVGLVGNDGGNLARAVDYSIVVPSSDTARIQEMHILIGHILCEQVEAYVSERSS